MENIRWILLLIGIVIVLGIYLVARLGTMEFTLPGRGRTKRAVARSRKAEPSVDGLDTGVSDGEVDDFDELFAEATEQDIEENVVVAPAREKPAQVREKPVRDRASAVSPDQVFSLFVMAPPGVPFRGQLLLGALTNAGMEYGDMQIFHYIEHDNGSEKVLFSAANIREPGIFDLSAMDSFTTEGIAFFMQVHSGVDAVAAFESMVESARSVANSLDATLCDATRSVLTQQTIGHMREEVIGCQLQQRVANSAS